MPTLSGPEYLNGQFSVAADGTVSLTTPPLSTAGGTISPGPVIITNSGAAPQATTSSPQAWLVSESTSPLLFVDGYSASVAPQVVGRRSRGTAAAPTAVQSGDFLLNLIGHGRATTIYNVNAVRIEMQASENWTATANGTRINFATTAPGTLGSPIGRMTINQGVVIGNPAPDPGQGGLVLNANAAVLPAPPAGTLLQIGAADGSASALALDAFGSTPTLSMRAAINTAASPQPLNSGAFLFSIFGSGYGATAYANNKVGITAATTEAWSDTANGTCLRFRTTLNGTTTLAEAMRIDHSGRVGIGITVPTAQIHTVSPAGIWAATFTGSTTSGQSYGLSMQAGSTAADYAVLVRSSSGADYFNVLGNGNVGIGTAGPTEKLSVSGQAAAGLNASAVRSGPNGADATTSLINFQSFDKSVTIGGIVRSATNQVTYVTSSDERLKDAITESKRGLDALMAIKVSDYKMGKTASQGLLAQDVATVYPEAVHEGGKDPNLQPWMLDYGRLTPLLIKGMQQQQEMIAALQAKVAALESATVH
jgi:hypothetical protein